VLTTSLLSKNAFLPTNKPYLICFSPLVLCASGFIAILIFNAKSSETNFWITNGLRQGTSQSSETFNNPCLAHANDFKISSIELWSIS
jgi:hypothetical protein